MSRVAAPLRILHVTAPGAFGGRETAVAALAAGLRAAGHDVEVLAVFDAAPEAREGTFVEGLQAAGVPVRALSLPPRAYRREGRALREAAASTGAQVVHSHGYRTDVVAALALARDEIPLVSTAHGFTGGGWKNRLYERLQTLAWRRCAAVIAVSGPLARTLVARGVEPARVRTIRNAWRPAREPLPRSEARGRLGIRKDELAIGWVGRVSREKGPDVALDALAALGRPDARLHVVGAGPMRNPLEEGARERGLGDRVRWHGAVPGAGALLGAFDLLLLSSRTEGTPMVLFEAMEAGVPIVATAVGGVPDVLSDREAWLVPAEDASALAAAVGAALADREDALRRAARAGERVRDEFAVEPWVDAHVALYREVLAGGGGA